MNRIPDEYRCTIGGTEVAAGDGEDVETMLSGRNGHYVHTDEGPEDAARLARARTPWAGTWTVQAWNVEGVRPGKVLGTYVFLTNEEVLSRKG